VSYPYTVPQVGESRRDHGAADGELLVVEGPGALEPTDGRELDAIVRGLDEGERVELDRLEREVLADIEASGLPLNADGQAARGFGIFPVLADADPDHLPAADLIARGELAKLVRRGFVDLDGERAATYRRWADLWIRWHEGTVGVWLGPAPDEGS